MVALDVPGLFAFCSYLALTWSFPWNYNSSTEGSNVHQIRRQSSSGRMVFHGLRFDMSFTGFQPLLSDGVRTLEVDVFWRIPYARSPSGMLRFAAPVLRDLTANSEHNFTTPGPGCLQITRLRVLGRTPTEKIDEDCLQLNVFTPVRPEGASGKLPVMVYIHGGSYAFGSGIEYDGRLLALNGLVVVTINYRLGMLGFFSSGANSSAGQSCDFSGNYGLMDQVAALKWISRNIEHFGGDAGSVTLVGNSAGASSVQFLLLSTQARGLFHRVISQSGTVLSDFSMYEPHTNLKETSSIHWRVSVDGDLVRRRPLESLRNLPPHVLNVPIMIGSVVSECSFNAIYPIENLVLLGVVKNININSTRLTKQDFDFLVHKVYRESYGWPSKIIDALKSYYERNCRSGGCDYKQIYKQICTDFQIYFPTFRLGHILAERHRNVFFYYFNYTPPSDGIIRAYGLTGFHELDLNYLFGAPFTGAVQCCYLQYSRSPTFNYTDHDREVSHELMTRWSNFIKSGNPTHKARSGSASGKAQFTVHADQWLPIVPGNLRYLHFTASGTRMADGFFHEGGSFWEKTVEPFLRSNQLHSGAASVLQPPPCWPLISAVVIAQSFYCFYRFGSTDNSGIHVSVLFLPP